MRAEVGDTIRILFKNNATRPYSMHPHGVFYDKDSEGAPYDDGTSGTDKEDDAVPSGKTHIYTWEVPERAGPGPNDPSSIVWLYHSHTNELKDVESGLVGAMIITRHGMADADGKPKDVDREFVCLYLSIRRERELVSSTTTSQTFTSDPKGVKKLEFAPVDNEGNFSGVGSGFTVANAKFAINGYIYGTGPMMTMKKGERVRWYLVALGEQFSVHTPHWHGNVVLHDGKRTRCRSPYAGANGDRGHGSRQSRHLDVPLPHRRPHGCGNGDAVQGRTVDQKPRRHLASKIRETWSRRSKKKEGKMLFRKCLVAFGLTLLCLPISLSAQAGWKVVKHRTNSCQISVPENGGQSIVLVRSDAKVRVFSAETQGMVAEKMLENTPKLVFYVMKSHSGPGSAADGHLSSFCAREPISRTPQINVKPDYREDRIKRIVATFAADK